MISRAVLIRRGFEEHYLGEKIYFCAFKCPDNLCTCQLPMYVRLRDNFIIFAKFISPKNAFQSALCTQTTADILHLLQSPNLKCPVPDCQCVA